MAEKHVAHTFESIMKELKAGVYRPIYLLMGDEAYFIDKISDYIAENAVSEEERAFNQVVVYGLDTTPAQVMDAAHAMPMMAKYQVVIIREAQLMRGIEQLEKYFRKPIQSTIFVVCYKKEPPKSRKGWVGEAEKNGVVFESKKLRDYALPGFVTQYLKVRGADIEQKAAMMVSESIGADLSRIASELDKMLISMPEGKKRITPDTVEQNVGISKDFNIFELRDAIVKKDVVKANTYFFQNLMAAYYCPNKTHEEELAAWLGLRGGWAARDYLTAMRLYNATKVMYIIQKLRTVAAKSNGLDNRNTTEGELMQELVFFILH